LAAPAAIFVRCSSLAGGGVALIINEGVCSCDEVRVNPPRLIAGSRVDSGSNATTTYCAGGRIENVEKSFGSVKFIRSVDIDARRRVLKPHSAASRLQARPAGGRKSKYCAAGNSASRALGPSLTCEAQTGRDDRLVIAGAFAKEPLTTVQKHAAGALEPHRWRGVDGSPPVILPAGGFPQNRLWPWPAPRAFLLPTEGL
jgi:hypothetical protein